MNIIEEQNMNGETNPDDTGNTPPPTVSTSAKKVYTTPELHVLCQINVTLGNKDTIRTGEGGRNVTYSPS